MACLRIPQNIVGMHTQTSASPTVGSASNAALSLSEQEVKLSLNIPY